MILKKFKIEKIYFSIKASMASSSVHDISHRGFSLEVLNYEKTRPSYTTESLNNIIKTFGLVNLNETVNVLDLASGTGKFTKFLYFFIIKYRFG